MVVVVEKGRRHMKVNLRLNFWLTFVMNKKETSLSLTLKKTGENHNIICDGHGLLETFHLSILEIHYRKTKKFINIQHSGMMF